VIGYPTIEATQTALADALDRITAPEDKLAGIVQDEARS
jgi:hypothetical protein